MSSIVAQSETWKLDFLPPFDVVAFSGHRPIYESSQGTRVLVRLIQSAVRALVPNFALVLGSGCCCRIPHRSVDLKLGFITRKNNSLKLLLFTAGWNRFRKRVNIFWLNASYNRSTRTHTHKKEKCVHSKLKNNIGGAIYCFLLLTNITFFRKS